MLSNHRQCSLRTMKSSKKTKVSHMLYDTIILLAVARAISHSINILNLCVLMYVLLGPTVYIWSPTTKQPLNEIIGSYKTLSSMLSWIHSFHLHPFLFSYLNISWYFLMSFSFHLISSHIFIFLHFERHEPIEIQTVWIGLKTVFLSFLKTILRCRKKEGRDSYSNKT